MENYGASRGFSYIYIYIDDDDNNNNNNNNNGLTIIKIKNSYTKHESPMKSFYPIILGEYLN